MDAILLSSTTLARFSEPTRREILDHYGAITTEPVPRAADRSAVIAPAAGDEEGPPDLTVAMVRKLTKNVSDKTLSALRIIGHSDGPVVHLKDVLAAVAGANEPIDLRGVWSAITRRTRAVLGDPEASLIWWEDEGVYEGDEYVDHIGRVSPMTHKSLKTYFGG